MRGLAPPGLRDDWARLSVILYIYIVLIFIYINKITIVKTWHNSMVRRDEMKRAVSLYHSVPNLHDATCRFHEQLICEQSTSLTLPRLFVSNYHSIH